MKNLVSAFDKTTELLVFEVEIPKEKLGAVRELMAWTEPEDELYGYDLSKAQLQQLEFITGATFDPERFDFQLASHKQFNSRWLGGWATNPFGLGLPYLRKT